MELIFGTALIIAWIVFNSIQNDGKKLPKRLFVEKLIECFSKKEIDVIPALESSARHYLKKSKKGVGCYQILRTFLPCREADEKTKKILIQCTQCKKSYCLPCFNEKDA